MLSITANNITMMLQAYTSMSPAVDAYGIGSNPISLPAPSSTSDITTGNDRTMASNPVEISGPNNLLFSIVFKKNRIENSVFFHLSGMPMHGGMILSNILLMLTNPFVMSLSKNLFLRGSLYSFSTPPDWALSNRCENLLNLCFSTMLCMFRSSFNVNIGLPDSFLIDL